MISPFYNSHKHEANVGDETNVSDDMNEGDGMNISNNMNEGINAMMESTQT